MNMNANKTEVFMLSNGDQIRKFNDNELARFFTAIYTNFNFKEYVNEKVCITPRCPITGKLCIEYLGKRKCSISTHDKFLFWLKSDSGYDN